MTAIGNGIRIEIERQLAKLAADRSITLLMAVESGSRAWGFPSPDSDYDVRFIYLRSTEDYLTLRPVRDVIELPISDDLDINGWDIRKALQLLMNHNAVVAEWMSSPIRYQQDHPIVARLTDLADRYFDPRGYALHYSSLGRSNAERWNLADDKVLVKRYFYSLRPALSIRAIRMNPAKRPPMCLQELLPVCDLSVGLVSEIEHLIALKLETREAGMVKRFTNIEQLIANELERASGIRPRTAGPGFEREANDIFRSLVLG